MICVCGHIKDEHYTGTISGIPVCDLCRELDMDNEYHEFKLDNLQYLEEKANES